MKELVLEIGTAINDRIGKKEDGASTPTPHKDEPADLQHSDSLAGKGLDKQANKNSYMTIDRFIASHPEFEHIKDEAKAKVLARVNKYRDDRRAANVTPPRTPSLAGDQSPTFRSDFSASPLNVKMSQADLAGQSKQDFFNSPLMKKQRSID